MTLWGFVSDVHGNRRALDRVEAVASARRIDQFACLGDVIGRGDPEGCIAWVQDHAVVALAGNRDLDHLDWVSTPLQEVVRSWPRSASRGELLFSHGDAGSHPVLRSTAERRGFRNVATLMALQGARVWLFGHTHHARIWRLAGEQAERLPGPGVLMGEDERYVVNVGTAGLPLASKGGPSMVLYDDSERWLEIVPLP